MNETLTQPHTASVNEDFLPLLGTDHLELYVGNAKQSAYYYQAAFGYELMAYAGPETGLKDRASYVLQQNKIRLVLTSSLLPGTEISKHVEEHGDGVKFLSLWVDDAAAAFEATVARGARPHQAPQVLEDAHGTVVIASIHTYGDTVHRFVERKNYHGLFMPGFDQPRWKLSVEPVGLQYVDHCVGNVELGAMNTWVEFYEKVMGFQLLITFDDKDISTEYSALISCFRTATGTSNSPSTNRPKARRNHKSKSISSFTEVPVFNTLPWKPTISCIPLPSFAAGVWNFFMFRKRITTI